MWCALVLLTQPAATFAQKPDDPALQEKYEQAEKLSAEARNTCQTRQGRINADGNSEIRNCAAIISGNK
jgi:hypothetical protein